MPNPNVLTGSFKDESIRHTRNHSNTALKLHTRPVHVFITSYVVVFVCVYVCVCVCVQSVDEWLLV